MVDGGQVLAESGASRATVQGRGVMPMAGQKVGEVHMPDRHISTYSLAETFDIGCDTGTQVDPACEGGPFPFTGQLDRVVVNLTNADERSQEPPHEFVD